MKYLLVVCLLGALLCAALAQEEPDSVNAYGKHGESIISMLHSAVSKPILNCYKYNSTMKSCIIYTLNDCRTSYLYLLLSSRSRQEDL